MSSRAKAKRPDRQTQPNGQSGSTMARYPHPQVLLIDVGEAAARALRVEGFNVSTATFGTPYRVIKCDDFTPLVTNAAFPEDFADHDIVVVNLMPPAASNDRGGEKDTSSGEDDWWAPCTKGIVDPRPGSMALVKEYCDRIVVNGGIFVLFASPRVEQSVRWGHVEYRTLIGQDYALDNWGFLSLLGQLDVKYDSGRHVEPVYPQGMLFDIITRYARGVHVKCTLQPSPHLRASDRWVTLAKSKYGFPVAGAIVPKEGSDEGHIIIFPDIPDKVEFLSALFTDFLPNLSPQLFPDAKGLKWVEEPAYELPRVLELKRNIRKVEEETQARVSLLEQEIDAERRASGYLHDLIRETDTPLVKAVEATLKTLGFGSILNVDEHKAAVGDPAKEEDLRIQEEDRPLVLVEVKGIVGGIPTDEDARQVGKYIGHRVRELERSDIRGLTIINHERNRPGLERNREPFRELIITAAKRETFGLMTTWDLYRLARSFMENGWTHDHVQDLFYRDGRIVPVPSHYRFIGTIERFGEHVGAVGVRVEEGELALGDRIAFELPVAYKEQVAASLQIDGKPVCTAGAAQLVGIKTDLAKEQAREGTRVYQLVRNMEQEASPPDA